ncbi:MAG: thermonuclease family protein [Hyphomicrobiaceae bacterium]
MIDTTLKTYATRQLAAVTLALGIAASVVLVGVSLARPGPGTTPPTGSDVTGRPTIVDGDTLHFEGTKVRLEGIDAPEAAQTCLTQMGHAWPCGAIATRELGRLIGRNEVRCENRGTDKYGRMLGVCFAGATELNAEMVRLGHAWAFVKYSQAYVAVEAEARQRRTGIWQGPAEPAWDFRAGKWQVAEVKAPEGCAIKGNVTRNDRIYHMPWSPWYDKIRMDGDKGKRWFCSEDEAVQAGWRPAQSR